MGQKEPKNAVEYQSLEAAFREEAPRPVSPVWLIWTTSILEHGSGRQTAFGRERCWTPSGLVTEDDEHAELRELAKERGIGTNEMVRRIVSSSTSGSRRRT